MQSERKIVTVMDKILIRKTQLFWRYFEGLFHLITALPRICKEHKYFGIRVSEIGKWLKVFSQLEFWSPDHRQIESLS